MVDNSFEQDDDKSYDIRDILTKAKSERKEPAKKTYHKIDVPAYDTLKSSKKEFFNVFFKDRRHSNFTN